MVAVRVNDVSDHLPIIESGEEDEVRADDFEFVTIKVSNAERGLPRLLRIAIPEAETKSKMGEGAKGRIGLRSSKMPVWIRRNRLSVGRGPSSALSSKRVRLRQRSQ